MWSFNLLALACMGMIIDRKKLARLSKASGSEANITTACEMEIIKFLWLIWDLYLPLAPTK